MARKPRVHFPGALYHVIARGNQRQAIFIDDTDRRRYLDLLQESQLRFNYSLYAYVLMGNHVHHLIQIDQTPLAKVMQNILFRYTRYWNAKYEKVGHLFQGRYKAILCDKDSYLLELIRYLHLNPVRSKLVNDPDRYPWSSHRAYLEGTGRKWLALDKVLPLFAKTQARAVTAYRRFVRDALQAGHRDDLYEVVEQTFLGDEQFVESVEGKISASELNRVVELNWEEVKEAVCNYFNISPLVVMQRGHGRKNAKAKRIMAWIGREVGGFTNQETARLLRQDAAALSRGTGKLAEELSANRDLRRDLEKLCDNLREGKKVKMSIRHA
jgi:REP element-mobilizing transposase RayT